MIDNILFVIIFIIVGLGLVLISRCEITSAHGVDVSCRCGAKVATGVIIVDGVDLFYLERSLSEACPACRAARRNRSLAAERPNPQSSTERESRSIHVC